MYPAKPPWCSLVMTPSKPLSRARAACVQNSSTTASAERSLCGYRRIETDPGPNGAGGRAVGGESVSGVSIAVTGRCAARTRGQMADLTRPRTPKSLGVLRATVQ